MEAPSFSPDPSQTKALDHPGGTLLITGPAGTGKTAVLRGRFARLIEGGAEPERVALVVGSRRARDDARATLLARLHASLPGLRVLTFHGLALALLTEREGEPPEVLSAAERFAKGRELLATQDGRVRPQGSAGGGSSRVSRRSTSACSTPRTRWTSPGSCSGRRSQRRKARRCSTTSSWTTIRTRRSRRRRSFAAWPLPTSSWL